MKLSHWAGLGRLLLYWTGITTLSGAVIYAFSLIAADLLNLHILVALIIGSAVGGLIAGLYQQSFIRPFLPARPFWLWMTVLGWLLSIPVLVGLTIWLRGVVENLSDGYALTLYLLAAGFSGVIASFGQWAILRTMLANAYWWLLANAVGWLMAWLAVLAAAWFFLQGELPLDLSGLPVAIALGALAGWLVGLEQGIALVGMIAQASWERTENSVE